MSDPAAQILAFATKGASSNEEERLRALLAHAPARVDWFPFDYSAKFRSFRQIVRLLKSRRFDLAVMEGTGLAGGLALLWSRLWRRCRYVVSSGDAVGPWVGSVRPSLGWLFSIYEKRLCRRAAGFIGWTPYLVGRALTFGCPRAVTAPGFALHPLLPEEMAQARKRVRAQLGIPDSTIVFGLVGSLVWNRRVRFCYGWELVQAIARVDRQDVAVMVVGDGSGLDALRTIAHHNQDLARRVFLTGGVSSAHVMEYLAAMDVASLPQSVDAVGSFRYTTKISEYVAARLPVVTGQIPMAYDLDGGWMWRLPGRAPWEEKYVDALARLMQSITPDLVQARRDRLPEKLEAFDRGAQVRRVAAMIHDILQAEGGPR
jgi:glycosyltransferase involved in cell wall biosynthesis